MSDYKDKYVFKGGFYLQKVLGVSTRSTMDLDFKYSCVEMSDKILLKEINEICGLNQTSNIVFSCLGIEDISAEMKYSGKTVRIEAHFFNVRKRFSIDVAIGDMVTPEPGYFEFETPFLMERFTVLSYSIETIIAEKFETLVSRGVNNSRSKDLFDLYLLEHHGYDKALLNSAMINTFFTEELPWTNPMWKICCIECLHFSASENSTKIIRGKISLLLALPLRCVRKASFGFFQTLIIRNLSLLVTMAWNSI